MIKIGKLYKILSNFYYVKVDDISYECKAKGKFKNDKVELIVGDNVEIEISEKEFGKGNIISVLERKNFTIRPSVANIDKLIIVLSISKPKLDYLLLDKQLIYCIQNKIEPIMCINKIDEDKEEEYIDIKKIYESIGYKVFPISAKFNIGIQELKQELKNNVCALSGNSGVGKSTLINTICGNNIMKEGCISEKIARGKHTTTHIELVKCNDLYIVDTPGFSTFNIESIKKDELYKYFIEFMQYVDLCEYRDCTHIKEEKCGIKEAVEQNKINKERYERYKIIYNNIKK